MAALSSLASKKIKKKTVLMRIDCDVDIKKGVILDDTRLLSSISSLKMLLKNKCKIILVGHVGRPDGHDLACTLLPIAKWYARYLNTSLQEYMSPFGGWQIGKHVLLYENIRFFMEEEQNDAAFAKSLTENADVFVNEAFAVSHRAHASTVGVTKYLPSYAGLHFIREVKEFENILDNPKRPLVVIIGGAKIDTKLPLVEKMSQVADYVLVGGEVADHTKELIKVQQDNSKNKRSMVLVADLVESGLDITRKSAENFVEVIEKAKTIVWNGPVGQTGKNPVTEQGTHILAHAVANNHAYSIIGGGDTLSYLRQHRILDKYNFVSVGGGAMLEFLSGEKLPAVEALKK